VKVCRIEVDIKVELGDGRHSNDIHTVATQRRTGELRANADAMRATRSGDRAGEEGIDCAGGCAVRWVSP
jgi:hypothetical protein